MGVHSASHSVGLELSGLEAALVNYQDFGQGQGQGSNKRRKDPGQSMRHPQLGSGRSPRTAEQSDLQDFDFRLEEKCMLNRYDMLRNVPPYANTKTQGYHTPPMSLLLGSTCVLC